MGLRRYAHRFFLPLSADPPVIFLEDWLLGWKFTPFRLLLHSLKGRIAYLLVNPSWSHENRRMVQRAARLIRKHRRCYGDHRIIYLANTEKELALFQENGIRAIFCNQNAFLDSSLFFPIPGIQKRFRAIYDAALTPFKRHFLASRVEDLALIAYIKRGTRKRDIRKAKNDLPRATWLLDGSVNPRAWLSDRQVNDFLNEARVGLCLSAEEGAMYASAQYLLAGLPVVTTYNRGGRDVFFEPEFVRHVPDDPDAVSLAVEEFCAAPPDPLRIRNRTLERFAEHRARFVDLLNTIHRDEGRGDDWSLTWPENLPNKLHGGGYSLRSHLSALAGTGGEMPWRERSAGGMDEGPADR